MIDVVADAERALDQLRDARAGPECGGITVGLGTLEKKLPKRPAIFFAQLRWSAGRRTREKGGLAATAIVRLPPPDAAWINLEPTRHVGGAVSGFNHGDGPQSTVLEMFRCTVWSHVKRYRQEPPLGRNFYWNQ